VGDFGDGISTSDAVRAGLATLSQRQRAVVVLHDLEGFTHAEIASTLGIPEGTAKSDLHLARRRMRAHLSRYRLEMF
jgi:RNA polymerase sigma-70 factor (ECF subfamily)